MRILLGDDEFVMSLVYDNGYIYSCDESVVVGRTSMSTGDNDHWVDVVIYGRGYCDKKKLYLTESSFKYLVSLLVKRHDYGGNKYGGIS